jgi:uncharacterized protein (DUF488 family)
MSAADTQPIFTIGHSNLEIGKFIALLRQHGIQAVADVRSSPYSQYNPQFNRELLQKSLQEHGVDYVFLGQELGARRSERECYLEGLADYEFISQLPALKRGIERLVEWATKIRIALMCAEKNPVGCHRGILLVPQIRRQGLQVLHVLSNGAVETHEQTEKRLLRLFALDEDDLFCAPEENLLAAYKLQGQRIAAREEVLLRREGPPNNGH